MANVLVDDTYLSDIADSIRVKNGTQNTYMPSQMASAIDNIPTSGGAVLGTKTIVANGTYPASSDNLDGFSSVVVDVAQAGSAIVGPFDRYRFIQPADSNGAILKPSWAQPFEIGVKFLFTALTSKSQVLFGCTTSNNYSATPTFEIQPTSSADAFWFGIPQTTSSIGWSDSITKAQFPITAGTWYFAKLGYDGENFYASVTDGTTTESAQAAAGYTPPDSGSSNFGIGFGGIAQSVNHYASNTVIDLAGSYIELDGSIVWGSKGQ